MTNRDAVGAEAGPPRVEIVRGAPTEEELAAKVESRRVEQLPFIPDVPRWMVLFFGSTLLMAGIQAEVLHNTSIWREAKRLARNALAQHDFPSDREGWMERHEKKGARR